MTPTPEQMAKLPRWAQEHINEITRQREVAIKALNEWTDAQTPAPFFFDDMQCTGEKTGPTDRRRYVQTHRMIVEHKGVRLDIALRQDGDGIDLQWDTPGRSCRMVACVPRTFQGMELVAKENMR